MLRFAKVSHPVTPAGSQPPCGWGKAGTPIRIITARPSLPPAASPCTTVPPSLRLAYSRFPPRAYQAYHVPPVVPTDGGRMPLYTGGDCTCVRRPLKSPEPAPHPILGLEPLSRLSSARFTMRNTEASLTLPLPVIPRSRLRVRLTLPTPAACLRPHRYQ
jgi:hypothetical protein